MKTTALTFLFLVLTSTLITAQTNTFEANTVQTSTSIEDGITLISWETRREINSSYFLIEKSYNGIDFVTIHSESASGSTHTTTTYHFEDLAYDSLAATYRITLVCMDGSRLAYEVTSDISQSLAVE